MRITVPTLPVIVAMIAFVGSAHAQEAAADALFASARAAMAKADFERACEQFRASDKLDPALGTELNLADCEEKRGRLASAWELFRTVEEKLAPNDERLAVAHGRARALQARVPRLTLTLAAGSPPGSAVRDGTMELGAAAFGLALPMDPGPHELVVSAPGFAARTFSVQLAEAESRALTVSVGPATEQARAVSPAFAARPARRDVSSDHPSQRTWGFVLGGVGVAGLGLAAVSGLLMLDKKGAVKDGCQTDKSCTSSGLNAAHAARTWEIVSNVSWAAGAVALGAGAYLVFTSGSGSKQNTALAFGPAASGAQLSLSRSW